ncbi:MAG: tRNA (adenosine(37)-N6)-dimethylallyltransferase MiaA [Candidatus Obscuribacter sp.]|nr:tRNA (adenosine(37)-N6)-dimethylallyltransferase MiaA [Candidatus Obscuribacter sp.]
MEKSETAIATAKPLVIAIVGSTCTGKTRLAIELGQKLKSLVGKTAEVLACDSRTVYRHMDIGTAKPSLAEQAGIKHHMLDLVNPDQVYTAANFKEEGERVLSSLISQGKVPIVCGGTGLYARVLLEGMNIPAVPPDEKLRAELQQLVDEKGVEALHEILEELDPDSLQRIQRNDVFRLSRAIEVSRALGLPFSQAAGRSDVPYDVLWLFLNVDDRQVLKKRIIDRLQEQVKAGVVDETRHLLSSFGRSQSLTNAVPYKEYLQFLDGQIDLDTAHEEAVKHNYQLARRQIMWFRANKNAINICVDKSSEKEQFEISMKEISLKLALQK